jgi:hypothetical protein
MLTTICSAASTASSRIAAALAFSLWVPVHQ